MAKRGKMAIRFAKVRPPRARRPKPRAIPDTGELEAERAWQRLPLPANTATVLNAREHRRRDRLRLIALADPSPAPGVDGGTAELRNHHEIVEEGSQLAGDKPHARVVDQRPLDRYFARGELSPNGAIARALFEAGHRLRTDWAIAGLEPRIIGQLGPRSQAQLEFSERRVAAWQRKDGALKAMPPLHRSVLIFVVCQDGWARDWALLERLPRAMASTLGMGALRLALANLAAHYGIPS